MRWISGIILLLNLICITVVFIWFGGCFSSEKNTLGGIQEGKDDVRKTWEESIKTVEESKKLLESQSGSGEKNVSESIGDVNIQSTLTPQTSISLEGENTENTPPLPVEMNQPQVSEEKNLEEGTESGDEQKTSDGEMKEGEGTVASSEEMGQDLLSKVKIGMNYSDVVKILGEPDMLVSSQNDKDIYIYLWKKPDFLLYGKFEKGILVRHSGRYEESVEAPPLTEDLYAKVVNGMSIEDVNLLLKRDGKKISGGETEDGIYLWSDNNSGTSFSAKFEGGKLVRKSSFYSKLKTESTLAEQEDLNKGEVESNELRDGEVVEQENLSQEVNEGAYGKGIVTNGKTTQEQSPSSPNEGSVDNSNLRESELRQKVVSIGKRNFEDQERDESQQFKKEAGRKAKLPEYTYQLREGSYEINIHNPLDVEVLVGIRSDKRGKNLSIGPGATKSVKVPRGEYKIYYIRRDEPTRVIEGGSVNIDGLFVGDVDIHLIR